eukprot:COSAG01_NODE_9949_length_2294_cov_3.324829_4_plen_42_part_01
MKEKWTSEIPPRFHGQRAAQRQVGKTVGGGGGGFKNSAGQAL